jgi:hypothetical protein
MTGPARLPQRSVVNYRIDCISVHGVSSLSLSCLSARLMEVHNMSTILSVARKNQPKEQYAFYTDIRLTRSSQVAAEPNSSPLPQPQNLPPPPQATTPTSPQPSQPPV